MYGVTKKEVLHVWPTEAEKAKVCVRDTEVRLVPWLVVRSIKRAKPTSVVELIKVKKENQ